MRRLFMCALACWMMIGTASFAAGALENESVETQPAAGEAIVQIFGRMCEYHREDVEAALRAFKTVQQVEFLNDHGTVLVRYQPIDAQGFIFSILPEADVPLLFPATTPASLQCVACSIREHL
ncbi:MAG: hypothetical protein E8D51_02405 [Nitrospira sp.]|nr:MAG: hypothetical protein E8D51_02405 [Nitrospira sp.]